jgi:hypothetical protein
MYTEIRERTGEHPRTGNIRIGARAKDHCFVRKLRIAQLRFLTISRHVIAVSAQQREERTIYTKAKWIRCRSVFLIVLSFSSSPSIAARC